MRTEVSEGAQMTLEPSAGVEEEHPVNMLGRHQTQAQAYPRLPQRAGGAESTGMQMEAECREGLAHSGCLVRCRGAVPAHGLTYSTSLRMFCRGFK